MIEHYLFAYKQLSNLLSLIVTLYLEAHYFGS